MKKLLSTIIALFAISTATYASEQDQVFQVTSGYIETADSSDTYIATRAQSWIVDSYYIDVEGLFSSNYLQGEFLLGTTEVYEEFHTNILVGYTFGDNQSSSIVVAAENFIEISDNLVIVSTLKASRTPEAKIQLRVKSFKDTAFTLEISYKNISVSDDVLRIGLGLRF